ncbi:hypothetical protein [Halorubrum aethiopicum]|uniref:hypothetical protein n=1 Tax=Halorubrum aethiopicum TaxID=1758255 RepID=UPI000834EB5D|nr:hypothetical protein [Halorubrum aethiopicum]
MRNDDHNVDDEYEYAGWRIGRPTRTVEVDADDGSHTIEEGILVCELVTKDELREAKLDGGWIAHYVAPDGGIGFGLDDGNSGGVTVPYDLEAIIVFPTPMTEREADEWLPDKWFHDYPDIDVPGLVWFEGSGDETTDLGDIDTDSEYDTDSDTGILVETEDGEMVIESDTTAADILEDPR